MTLSCDSRGIHQLCVYSLCHHAEEAIDTLYLLQKYGSRHGEIFCPHFCIRFGHYTLVGLLKDLTAYKYLGSGHEGHLLRL